LEVCGSSAVAVSVVMWEVRPWHAAEAPLDHNALLVDPQRSAAAVVAELHGDAQLAVAVAVVVGSPPKEPQPVGSTQEELEVGRGLDALATVVVGSPPKEPQLVEVTVERCMIPSPPAAGHAHWRR